MRRLAALLGMIVLVSGLIAGWRWIANSDFRDLPESPRERIELYYRAIQSRDEEKAKRLRASFEDQPDAIDYQRFFEALDRMRSRDLEGAVSSMQSLAANPQLRPFVLFSSAETLYRLERPAEAAKILVQILVENKQHLDAHRLLGAIHFDLGSYSQAIPHLVFVVENSPESAGTHYMLAVILHEFGDTESAIEHFRKVFELGLPENMLKEALSDYAEALIDQQLFAEADRLLQSHADSSELLSLRAKCLWNLQRQEEARELISQAQKLDDRNLEYRLMLLNIQMAENQFSTAVQTAQEYLKSDPHDTEVLYILSQAFARQNMIPEYEREIERYQESLDLMEKLRTLNRQAISDASDPIVRDQLAEVCDQLGKPELAEMWRKAAAHCRAAK